ncbi:hypothetical protein BDY17DRAFT_253006, partial [Neohortaea acidophila]
MSDGNFTGTNNDTTEQRQGVKSGRTAGVRSASPAKRSAADMEGEQMPRGHDAMDTQESVRESVEDTTVMDTSTTNGGTNMTESNNAGLPTIDEQVETVMKLVQNQQLDEGTVGYAVSMKWLGRVMSRSTARTQDSTFSKEAQQGDIGPVDCADIVPDGAWEDPVLKGPEGKHFIPLKPGLTIGDDFQVLPEKAYGLIVGWYGNVQGQKPICRFVHNTAGEEATQQNMQYELYPPVITVRKIPQLRPETEDPPPASKKTSYAELRLKEERRSRGQLSPEDAVQLVSSQSERFNDFLKRSKEAAGIPRDHKVRIFRLLDASQVTVVGPTSQRNGVLSPPLSRSGSPRAARAPKSKLILDLETFNAMELGKDMEHIDAKDATNDSNYNGKSTMQVYSLFHDTIIALEEMIGGPAGGEFASDRKKEGGRLPIASRMLGSVPGSANPSGRTSPAPTGGGMMTRGRQRRDGRTQGTVGLNNLGNTCYMNSALQCIRSVEELAIYFLSGKYKSEINTNNPLGHNGVMAKRYAELLNSIYAENITTTISPNAFKKALGNIQPMFSGYGQQDSQEFLSFLVDALHEDLNRIQKKPYNENPDSDDKTVHDPEAIIKLGEIYRSNHKARNDSVAMDLFSGFYKNTMECPVCDKVSITFDPYSLLTVQLPIESTFQHNVTFVPYLGRPVNHSIDIDKNSTIKMLKEYIASKHHGVQADRLWMVEVYSHKVYKVFENTSTLGEMGIQPSDYIFAFELSAPPTNFPSPSERKMFYSSFPKADPLPDMDDPKADQFVVPVLSRQKTRSGFGWDWILHPMFIVVTREEAQNYDAILKKVLYAVSRLTSRRLLTEMGGEADESTDESASNVEMKDEASVAEETAHVSERSTSSEEEYVEVSLSKSAASSPSKQLLREDPAHKHNEDDRPVPSDYWSPNYPIPSDLRNSLFVLNYAQSAEGMHCSGMNCVKDKSERIMQDRVKPPVRRSSVQSSSSGEGSTTSTGSGTQANGAASEESDEDEMDKPDLTADRNESNSYFIKLGEGIVLDWYPEAVSALFGGQVEDADDNRGHFVSSPEGKDLPDYPDAQVEERKYRRESRKKHGITLEDCFVETGKREVLSEDNAWYCNRCKELRRATKTLEIWTIPDILVVHLKRFGGNRSFRDKIDVLVDYPIEGLDMTQRVGLKEDGKEYVYDLFAVDNHYGGLGGGHYTAVAKNFYDGQWYDYNDAHCNKLTDHKKSAAAYLLFYRRRSDQPLGGPMLQELVYEARNPSISSQHQPDNSTNGADASATGDESDSGEGRLGGPNGSTFPGSSSAAGAGVGS